MIRIRFLAPREGKKGNGCSFPNPLLLNVGLIRKVSYENVSLDLLIISRCVGLYEQKRTVSDLRVQN